jgi:iron complex outermembrane receptor protein
MGPLLFAVALATNVWTELPPVTVVGSRIEADAARLPGAVMLFDAAAVASSGAQSLDEFLEKKANIARRTVNGNPLQAQLSLRGFGENSFGRLKVLFDGEELNTVDMAAPNLARVALASVGRVEILHGPQPVLYGDGAVAGVINVQSDTLAGDPLTRLSVRGGSDATAGASFLTRGRDGSLVYSAAVDAVRSDGFRDCSAYDLQTVDAALRHTAENGAFWGIKANASRAFYEMPGAVTRAVWKRDRTAAAYRDDWCRQWTAGVGFESKARLADGQALYVDGRFSFQERRSHWGDYGYANDTALYGLFVSPRYVNTCALGAFENTLTIGADGRYDRFRVADGSGYNAPLSRFGRFRGALFFMEEFALTETLSLTAGVRGERIESRWTQNRALADPAAGEGALDAEAGVVWRPWERVKAYLKATRFHRSPFCDELSHTEDGRLLNYERGFSFDLGAEALFCEEWTADADFYALVMDDEIFYNPYATPGLYGWNGYNCNSPAQTRRFGVDAGVAWRREKTAEASLRAGAVRAVFAGGPYEGRDVPLVPAVRLRAEIGVWLHEDLEVKGGCRFVGRQRLMGDFTHAHTPLPSVTLFDVSCVWEPSSLAGWRLTFTVDNLFDRDFADFAGWSEGAGAYYYPACGRSFLATLSYSF